MNIYIDALSIALTPQVVAAFIGGLLGASAAADIQRYGLRLTVIFTALGVLAAGAVAEYLTAYRGITSVLLHVIISPFVGMCFGYLLDAIRVTMPNLFNKLLSSVGDTAIAGVTEFIKRWLGKKQ